MWKIIERIKNPKKLFYGLVLRLDKKVPYGLPAKLVVKAHFYRAMGYDLDLKHPKTFNEKLNWLKLYDRNPLYTKMVDKYEVKDYVAGIIGKEYIIPTLGVWDSFDDIDFNKLPEQFVLKCTHDSGGVVICRDKSTFNISAAREKLNHNMHKNFYYSSREYPYKNVKPRIIAEKYMEQMEIKETTVRSDLQGLTDYKFYCFNGEPKYCQVIRDRDTHQTIDFYDMDWKHQEFVGLNPNANNGKTPVERPKDLQRMRNICRKLSKDMSFVRIDLYSIDDKTYYGEITFYPNGGYGKIRPEEWNKKLGEMINLPSDIGGVNMYM